MLPCCKVKNLASLSCLALSRKYFSKNLLLKFSQLTSSSLVCICCCIPTHQYSTSLTKRKVANASFCSFEQASTQNFFSQSLIHAPGSSGVALPLNLAGLCLMKSSMVAGHGVGCGSTTCCGYITSTNQWIAWPILSTKLLA